MDGLNIFDLNFSYDDVNIIFQGVTLQCNEGERVCILGGNGSGKSTLLKILSNIISCNIKLDFFGKKDTNIREVIKYIGYVPDKPFLYKELTGFENLIFILNVFGEKKDSFIKKAENLCKDLNILNDLHMKVKNYSLGMQHKLFLAAILSRDIKLLLLDEPLTALDIDSQGVAINELINKSNSGIALIFTSHIEQVQNQLSNKRYIINEKSLHLLKEGGSKIEKISTYNMFDGSI